ncbi:hypothetical protein BDK51DRAFT_37941 [Blyttiomyces helicus]|uniref:Uncharacterized protein n=1 Tax=Blyttiomyces helicus TaxID=388810 RepID=A0A4P9VWA8_9FUNG|nr:hypothetical protein BDK51DRAFT_37941 [Blyttiomyces helicus]|eukprot:RKO83974.1 hypothetical protein BDK51DRAFT_37941 [Blyttiomyces helicus]
MGFAGARNSFTLFLPARGGRCDVLPARWNNPLRQSRPQKGGGEQVASSSNAMDAMSQPSQQQLHPLRVSSSFPRKKSPDNPDMG